MTSSLSTPHAKESYRIFDARAQNYDAGIGGWHSELALDYVKWIAPQPGEIALDLACGTGLVTLPLAAAIGATGKVIAIDLSPGMLSKAQEKSTDGDSAPITWIEGDVTCLSSIAPVRSILGRRGGFDIITLCSALVLLPDPPAAIKHWSTFLKQGGRMIIDVPTEDKTLQFLFTVDLRLAVGISLPFDRQWVKDLHSLEKLYTDAGLEVGNSWRTKSYIPEKWYESNEEISVFNEQTSKTYTVFSDKDKLEEARKLWPEMWKKNLTHNKFWDGHVLYVTVGKKPHESVF